MIYHNQKGRKRDLIDDPLGEEERYTPDLNRESIEIDEVDREGTEGETVDKGNIVSQDSQGLPADTPGHPGIDEGTG